MVSAPTSDLVVLDRLEFATQHALSPAIPQRLSAEQWQHHALDKMVYELRATILGERLAEQTQTLSGKAEGLYCVPDSPWQHFKLWHQESWWLGWLIRRRPIQFARVHVRMPWSRTIKTQQFATFPACPIKTPEDFRGPIVVRHEQTYVS